MRSNRTASVRAAGPAAAALLLAACAAGIQPVKPDLALDRPGARWVAKMMRTMSLEEKAAQMVACRYTGAFLPSDGPALASLRDLVGRLGVGGLILFGGEAYETACLTNALQGWARAPLLIAADLERGAGNQITGATLFPTLMGVGASGSEAVAYDMGRVTAVEGRAVGIHMTYAPVVDVNINPDNPIINTRSIGEDPRLVGRLAAAFIKGCQEHGMIATAKHFPGHGDTDLDSHILLPVIKADRSRLEAVELAPYRDAIAAGVQAIMTAHLVVPALDPTEGLPATLSAPILTGLLRREMGFRGLVVTDAMEMGGVTNTFGPTEAALKAVLAGADMVLLPLEPDKVVPFLRAAARDGRIPPGRIEESARRILEAKARLGLAAERFVDPKPLPERLGTMPYLAAARRAFEAAATLVKNDGPAVPIPGPVRSIAVLSLSSDPGEYYAGRTFANAVRRRRPEAKVFYADADTGQEALDQAYAAAASSDLTICALFSSLSAWKGHVGLEPRHAALIQNLTAGPAPVVVLSFGSPYFLREFPDADAYLCFYRNQPQMQDLAARILFGEAGVSGRLPVSLPGLFPAGHGLVLER